MVRMQDEPIRVEDLMTAVRGDGDGAVALFLGTVRNHNAGRRVLRLEYSAYAEMAEGQMAAIEEQASSRFNISRVALVHRQGRLEIGETSVGVAVSAPHRAEAFEACRFIIDTLKKKVPIWKKEFFEGGEQWVEEPGR